MHDPRWVSRFHSDKRQAIADLFAAGRVALAGDAAHDNSPLGGQGMNAGIGDAVALAAARQLRRARNVALSMLDPVASRRLAWRLSMLTYR